MDGKKRTKPQKDLFYFFYFFFAVSNDYLVGRLVNRIEWLDEQIYISRLHYVILNNTKQKCPLHIVLLLCVHMQEGKRNEHGSA